MIIFGWILFCLGLLISLMTVYVAQVESRDDLLRKIGQTTSLLIFSSSLMICGAIFIICSTSTITEFRNSSGLFGNGRLVGLSEIAFVITQKRN